VLQLICEQSASHFRRMEKWFGIPLIILGTITTSTIFVQINDCDQYKQLASGFLSLSLTLISAIGKFMNYNELSSVFSNAARDCDNLVIDIQEQLSRPRKDRESVYVFTTKVKQTLKQLKDTPPFPNRVVEQYIGKIDEHFRDIGIISVDVTSGEDLKSGDSPILEFTGTVPPTSMATLGESLFSTETLNILDSLEHKSEQFQTFYS